MTTDWTVKNLETKLDKNSKLAADTAQVKLPQSDLSISTTDVEQCCKEHGTQKLVFNQNNKYLWRHYLNNMSRVFGQLEIHISNTKLYIGKTVIISRFFYLFHSFINVYSTDKC